jgi:hypothetical protein
LITEGCDIIKTDLGAAIIAVLLRSTLLSDFSKRAVVEARDRVAHARLSVTVDAAECVLASCKASQPCCGKMNFSMAASWLALGGQNKAIDNLLARWGIAEPIGTMGLAKRQTDRASFRGDSDLCWLCRTRRCCGKERKVV